MLRPPRSASALVRDDARSLGTDLHGEMSADLHERASQQGSHLIVPDDGRGLVGCNQIVGDLLKIAPVATENRQSPKYGVGRLRGERFGDVSAQGGEVFANFGLNAPGAV